jgi:CRISPR-associated protein Cst2
MNIAKEVEGEATIDIDALKEVLDEYKDVLLTDVYIGRRKGFMDNLEDDITELANDNENINSGTIKETVDQFSNKIPELSKQ